MFKTIASLLCCLSVPTHQKTPIQVYSESYELTDFSEFKYVADFELVRTQFIPHILKEFGTDIENLCNRNFMDERAQFVNRYMNVIALELAKLPENERAESIESIKLCIPSNEAEFKYIHGNFPIQVPPYQYTFNKNVCWPIYHATITERLNKIKQELSKNHQK